MRRSLAVGVVLCLAIVCIGWAAGEKQESAAELFKVLAYPEAERFDDSPGGPGIYQARYTTPHGPKKVAAWYRKAIDYEGADGSETGASVLLVNPIRDPDSGYRGSAQYVTLQPGKKPGEIGKARPLYETVLVKRTLTAVSVIVISRGHDEDRTYVTLTVINNVDK